MKTRTRSMRRIFSTKMRSPRSPPTRGLLVIVKIGTTSIDTSQRTNTTNSIDPEAFQKLQDELAQLPDTFNNKWLSVATQRLLAVSYFPHAFQLIKYRMTLAVGSIQSPR